MKVFLAGVTALALGLSASRFYERTLYRGTMARIQQVIPPRPHTTSPLGPSRDERGTAERGAWLFPDTTASTTRPGLATAAESFTLSIPLRLKPARNVTNFRTAIGFPPLYCPPVPASIPQTRVREPARSDRLPNAAFELRKMSIEAAVMQPAESARRIRSPLGLPAEYPPAKRNRFHDRIRPRLQEGRESDDKPNRTRGIGERFSPDGNADVAARFQRGLQAVSLPLGL